MVGDRVTPATFAELAAMISKEPTIVNGVEHNMDYEAMFGLPTELWEQIFLSMPVEKAHPDDERPRTSCPFKTRVGGAPTALRMLCVCKTWRALLGHILNYRGGWEHLCRKNAPQLSSALLPLVQHRAETANSQPLRGREWQRIYRAHRNTASPKFAWKPHPFRRRPKPADFLFYVEVLVSGNVVENHVGRWDEEGAEADIGDLWTKIRMWADGVKPAWFREADSDDGDWNDVHMNLWLSRVGQPDQVVKIYDNARFDGGDLGNSTHFKTQRLHRGDEEANVDCEIFASIWDDSGEVKLYFLYKHPDGDHPEEPEHSMILDYLDLLLRCRVC